MLNASRVEENQQENQQENQPLLPPSEDVSSWGQIAIDTLKQAGPNALRGAVVASRYILTAYFLGQLDEKLLAPNTLISLTESMLIVLGSRSLNSVSAEIGRLNGCITKKDVNVAPKDIGAV